MDIIYNKYKIIKNIGDSENTSLYLVTERGRSEKFIIKKISSPPASTCETVKEEFKNAAKEKIRIDKRPFSPVILDFFAEEENNYLLLEYKNEGSPEVVNSYPSIGKVLNNRYIIVRGIASGGFGRIYLIRDLSLPNKYWALKEMQEEGDLPEIMEKSFRIEAEMLSSLEHTSIPRISDFFIEERKLYLVMDYVSGETLKKRLNSLGENDFFSEEQIIKWAIGLCDVLSYLHNRPTPIIFRDLKPDNIMISSEGEIKLIDFGIARVFQGHKKETTKYALLTEGYAPQEQWYGKAEPRSDIYSLGATMYHLLGKVHPRKIAPEFPPLDKYNPSISPELKAIIEKSLKTMLKDRYDKIEDMKTDFLKIATKKYKKEKALYHLSQAIEYEKKQDYFNGNFEFMKALEFDENNHEILTGVARCCEKLNFSDKATFYYQKALKLNISEPEKNTIRKEISKLTGKLTSPDELTKTHSNLSKRLKEKTTTVKTRNPTLWPRLLIGSAAIVVIPLVIILIIVIIGLGLYYSTTYSRDDPLEYYNMGAALFEKEQYKEALSYYNKAIELSPDYLDAWNEKGICLYCLNKYDDAIKAYEKALTINSEDSEIWNNKGLALYCKGEYKDAIKCYNKGLNINSQDADLWYNKGLALHIQQEYYIAAECYEKALEVDPSYYNAWNDKGNVFYEQGKYDKALKCYEEALKINDKDGILWCNKGNALYYQQQYKKALYYYEKAIEINPDDYYNWHMKGLSLYGEGRYKEAIYSYNQALSLYSGDKMLWNDKGNSLYIQGRYEEALECYTKALEIDPDEVVWCNKGLALFYTGQYEEAVKCYEESLKINPHYITSKEGLEEALNMLSPENKNF